MPAASAGPAAAAAAPAEAEAAAEQPKEKTIFTVKLEKFDAAAKAKIIREVKAMMPNMNLVEVGLITFEIPSLTAPGQEVRRVGSAGTEGEPAQGGGREAAEDVDRFGRYRLSRISSCIVMLHVSVDTFWVLASSPAILTALAAYGLAACVL